MSTNTIDNAIQKLITSISLSIDNNQGFKIVLSKPRVKGYTKCIFTPYLSKTDIKFKKVLSSTTQDFTSNLEKKALSADLINMLTTEFYFLDFFGEDENIMIKISKKGTITIKSKRSSSSNKSIEDHNRKKEYLISPGLKYLHHLGITNNNGIVLAQSQKKFRQINKFIEIIDHLVGTRNISTIVDMGCGKGYLTFSVYAYLQTKYPEKKISVTGYDIRPELMVLCNQIAIKNNFAGLKFVEGNIGQIDLPAVDMLIALHACDIATDMAIHQGLKSSAEYIVLSPCCHKQIRKAITKVNEITSHGIFMERQAEMVTDTIRALLLESQGYKSSIFEFISSEHTAKNIMITAHKAQTNPNALSQVNDLKETYGIDQHYLEKLLQE